MNDKKQIRYPCFNFENWLFLIVGSVAEIMEKCTHLKLEKQRYLPHYWSDNGRAYSVMNCNNWYVIKCKRFNLALKSLRTYYVDKRYAFIEVFLMQNCFLLKGTVKEKWKGV